MYSVMYIKWEMMPKVRKQIYIDPIQEDSLKQLAKDTGVSEAEIIRQAIDRHTQSSLFPQQSDLQAWKQEKVFIEHLIEQGSVPGQRTWRREDLYE